MLNKSQKVSLPLLAIAIVSAVTRTSAQSNLTHGGSRDKTPWALSDDEASRREKRFSAVYDAFIRDPEGFTVSELKTELSKAITNEVSPIKVWGVKVLEIGTEPDDFKFLFGALPTGGYDGKLDPQLAALYLRRLFAMRALFEHRGEAMALDQFVSRASDPAPDVMDILLLGGSRSYWSDDSETLRTKKGKAQWRQLAHGKNPCMRMIGIMWSGYWADPTEALPLWRSALKEKYPYARYLALEQFQMKPLPGAKQILEEFLARKIDPKLSLEAAEIERKLSEKAKDILVALEKQDR